jgi:hypothetical protein
MTVQQLGARDSFLAALVVDRRTYQQRTGPGAPYSTGAFFFGVAPDVRHMERPPVRR